MDHGGLLQPARATSRARSGLDVAAGRQLRSDASTVAGGAGGARDAARVQRHVAALDALGGERAQRGQVRREAGGAGERGERRRSSTPASSSASRAAGCACSAPPTVPTASGMLERADEVPFRRRARSRAGDSAPVRAANACAPASTARQSWPVATSTASTPFMMPLLCVAARYGSSSAKRDAAAIAGATSAPSMLVGERAQRARDRTRPSVRFDRMRRPDAPAARCRATRSASASHSVLTRFAPIASRQSTWRWTTITPPSGPAAREHADVERAGPPPRSARRGHERGARRRAGSVGRVAQRARRRVDDRRRDDLDLRRSSPAPRRLGDEAAAGRAMRAAFDAAATTDGSSTAIGTSDVVAVDQEVDRDRERQRVRADRRSRSSRRRPRAAARRGRSPRACLAQPEASRTRRRRSATPSR